MAMAPPNVIIVNPQDKALEATSREAGLNVVETWALSELAAPERQRGLSPELLILDMRSLTGLPVELGEYRRRHPSTRIVLIARQLSVALMRAAMQVGVSECLGEPVTTEELSVAVRHVLGAESALPSKGKVFSFVGAKGGVGTTTLAVNVAAALAAPGASVVLLDLHTQVDGDAALLLGVEPRYSVIDALKNVSRLDPALMRGLVASAKCGVDVLASPATPVAEPISAAAVRTLLQWLSMHYDYVVIDMPRLANDVLDALEPMTMASVVVLQELSAVRHAIELSALLRQRYGKTHVNLLLNRFQPGAEVAADDIERIIRLQISSRIPSDYAAAVAAANAGQPLIVNSRSRLAKSLSALASDLREVANDSTPRPAPPLSAGAFAGHL